ncbi:esterase/lipase family protein [Burkholderia ambifaria]|uniref:esterase/lipase family protein n=1 Tax=Burkholderia ambifaria TaxID=152480 RepID=UPI001588B3B1|nr:alpha/beta hydrolase [Burkholderia ambifaria]MBR8333049.1 alpha/beta hydrolase [Burkholderia ambifaria]
MSDNQAGNQGGDSPFSDDAEQEVVRQMGRTAPDGSSYGTFTLTPASDTRQKELLCDVRPIIPVIFLPGVMGSLLTDNVNGDELFFAPNTDGMFGKLGALPALIGLWFTRASSREKQFDPSKAVVTPLGPINVGKHGKNDTPEQFVDEKEARRRGWGSIHRTSYHPVLAWLEETLNQPKLLGDPHGPWVTPDVTGDKWTLKPVIDTDPADYGAVGKGEKITLDSSEFEHFSKFRYRVYAIGYNWLQSNADSARQVIDGSNYLDPKTQKTTRLMGIKEIVAENNSGKAIILTHSMGGLVARMAIAMHGAADLMHGVFHNVQPATGAPVAVKRFRTGGGNEGGMNSFINGSLVGRDANEFVAVMANAPGPLELIPMPDYINGEPWWVFARLNGEPVMQLPKGGDAYNEIYLNSNWYGLVPDESLLDPAGTVAKKLKAENQDLTVSQKFKYLLKDVVTKQSQIKGVYHGKTYAAYNDIGALNQKSYADAKVESASKGKPSVEKGKSLDEVLTFGKVIWKGNIPPGVTEEELRAARFMRADDSHTGNVRVYLDSRQLSIDFEVQKVAKLPAGATAPDPDKNGIIPGDGTVPTWSAEAQARGLKPGVKGDPAQGVQLAFLQGGYDHQGSYDHSWTRWALLYSIVHIAQDAPEPSC